MTSITFQTRLIYKQCQRQQTFKSKVLTDINKIYIKISVSTDENSIKFRCIMTWTFRPRFSIFADLVYFINFYSVFEV